MNKEKLLKAEVESEKAEIQFYIKESLEYLVTEAKNNGNLQFVIILQEALTSIEYLEKYGCLPEAMHAEAKQVIHFLYLLGHMNHAQFKRAIEVIEDLENRTDDKMH